MLVLGSAHSIAKETAAHGFVVSKSLMPCVVSRGCQHCVIYSSMNILLVLRPSAPTLSKAGSGAAPADTPAKSLHTPTMSLHG